MQVQTLLQTSLVFWLAQQTLQGGVKPQSVSWGRVLPARGVGIGVKPAAAGALGALGNRYGTKAMKTGMGRYPGAQLGAGGYRSLGLGGRSGLKQGGYGGQGSYGAALGTGMGLGTGLTNGLGLGLGQGAKRGYGAGAGLGTLPGYGALAGLGYPGARQGLGLGYPTGQKAQLHKPGYGGGAGNYLGAGGYGAGVGQGAYLGGAAGKLGAAALGQGGYPLGAAGKTPGYGEGLTGYLGAMGGNGYGYGNGYGDAHGAGLGYASELADGAENKARRREALSTGAYAGQNQGGYGALGAGLDPTLGKYGAGGAAQVPYGSAPVIPTGLEGDGGYPYPAQQLNLGAEGAKTANKYGAGVGYGGHQAGFGAQLGAAHDVLGEHGGKYGDVNGALGNGYKG